MPPWLWLWLIGDLAVLIPAEVSNERHQIALYTGHGEIAPQVTAGTPYTLLLLFTILSGLTYAGPRGGRDRDSVPAAARPPGGAAPRAGPSRD